MRDRAGADPDRAVPQHHRLSALLTALDHAYPHDDLYLVADNLASHLSGPIRDWLTDHPRLQHAFIPVGAAWLNLIEGWWRIFRRKAFAGVSFADADDIAYATRTRYRPPQPPRPPVGLGRPAAISPHASSPLRLSPLRNARKPSWTLTRKVGQDADGVGCSAATLGLDGIVGGTSWCWPHAPRRACHPADAGFVVVQHPAPAAARPELLLHRFQRAGRLLHPLHQRPATQPDPARSVSEVVPVWWFFREVGERRCAAVWPMWHDATMAFMAEVAYAQSVTRAGS